MKNNKLHSPISIRNSPIFNCNSPFTNRNSPVRKGYTLVELLLTVALITILATISAGFYARFINQNGQANTVDRIVGSLRKAQTYAMSGKNNSSFGVSFNSSKIYLYQGPSFAARNAAFDETFDVPGSVAVTGLTEINFTKITGAPNTAGAVFVTSNNDTKTLTVNSLGVASD